MTNRIYGKIADLSNEKFINGYLILNNGKIDKIVEDNTRDYSSYILPGFIDSHIHIESSMLVPSQFARIAVRHGTIATVSDPHEIANVLGVKGVEYMIKDGKRSPVKFFFGAPSCVPATDYESSGARINVEEVEKLLKKKEIYYLSEVMNFPGVINNDAGVINKINAAIKYKKPVDGHAPGLTGDNLIKYTNKNITTDHECTNIIEAKEKLNAGMKILIREGSAAKSFDQLFPLTSEYEEDVMFCSDDLHPDDLIKGHINLLFKRSVLKGLDLFKAIKIASVNPVKHYQLNCGLLREGDSADFIRINNLTEFKIEQTFIEGEKVYDFNEDSPVIKEVKPINKFIRIENVNPEEIKIKATGKKIRVIEAFDKDLFTREIILEPNVKDNWIISDTRRDILKIVVVNRYKKTTPAVGFIKNFGLKNGALASSIAHDSHNIVAVGVNDMDIINTINTIINKKGGIAVNNGKITNILPLPVGGIMSGKRAEIVALKYAELNEMAKTLGCNFNAPFMTLSFMSLLVIPKLKLGDKGLFDVDKFNFTSLYV